MPVARLSTPIAATFALLTFAGCAKEQVSEPPSTLAAANVGCMGQGGASQGSAGESGSSGNNAGGASQKVLTRTSGGSVTDSAGNAWTLTSDGDVEENGSPVAGGGGTAELAFVNGTIWGQDASSGSWYSWNGNGWDGPSSTSPIGASSPPSGGGGNGGTAPSGGGGNGGAAPAGGGGTTYYVSASGNDSSDGRSPSTAFQHLSAPRFLVKPGDVVMVMNGTYGQDVTGSNALYLDMHGTPDAYIAYQAYPGHHPVIQMSSSMYEGIMVQGGEYVIIDGFEVAGMAPQFDLNSASAHQGDTSYAATNENCIAGDSGGNGTASHHIVVRNNIAHDCTGGGIMFDHVDYVTIENNVVYNNAWYSSYGGSGTDIWETTDIDSNTGYKIVIQGNTYYNNHQLLPTGSSGQITDGNGILIDDNMDTQNSPHVAYQGRTLVQNNVSYGNGGVGIGSYLSQHIDFVNNTTYGNGAVAPNGPQMGSNQGGDINYYNNIVLAADGQDENGISNVGDFTWDYNLCYGGNGPSTKGAHDVFADPRLVDASTDPSKADFHLTAGSPAIDEGTSQLAPKFDHDAKARPSGAGFDIGAYEY